MVPLLVVAEGSSSIFTTAANSPDQSRLKSSLLLVSTGGSGDDGRLAGALARFCDGLTLNLVGNDGALLRLLLTDVPSFFFLEDDDGE